MSDRNDQPRSLATALGAGFLGRALDPTDDELLVAVLLLFGDASKAHERLGWKREVSFPELVNRALAIDLKIESANV